MEIVYQKILKVFADHPEVFTERGLPVPRQIDINLGQPDDPEGWEVFFPGIFIAWSIKTAGDDPDVLTLELSVLQEPGAGTESFSNRLDEGLEYLKMLKAVKYLINGLRSDVSSPLTYKGERPGANRIMRYHVLEYTCKIDSYTDSIHKHKLTPAVIENIKLGGGKLKETNPEGELDLEIEIFGK